MIDRRTLPLYAGLGALLLAACTTISPAIGVPKDDPGVTAEGDKIDPEAAQIVADYARRLPQDEVVYFVIPDRFENGDPSNDFGGIAGSKLDHGFDPEAKGFYHGGDLRGLIERLDYIQGLGATAIWLGPIYQNKAVQGPPGGESSGYHGYWITDFTRPDAHLGTDEDMTALVEALHARGMKIYLDIITNHTADVIRYRECPDSACRYRSIADYPYTTRGGIAGEPINEGFMGDRPPFQTKENFARLTDPGYAWTPYVPEGEEAVKVPAWLNDLRYYHNRGATTFEGENSVYGDFSSLDDLMTENPVVVDGFIEIYNDWITKYRIDGFRIDTARHVNPEFWHAFNSAVIDHAASIGIPNFYVFGEVYNPNPAMLATFTRAGGFPAVLDFGMQSTLSAVLVDGAPTERFADLFTIDGLYADGAVSIAPTFSGNHDMGRFAGFLRAAHPDMSDEELLKRVNLSNAILMFSRGTPVIYYGDEQGFVPDAGGDQNAREDMMPSQVAIYNDNDLIGTDATTADSNFDTSHPIYRAIAHMAEIRGANEALRRGEQVMRLTELDGGVMAFSRLDGARGEYLVAFNTRNEPRRVNVAVDPRSASFEAIAGRCPTTAAATGVVSLSMEPLGWTICRSSDWEH
ncbi:MAG: alpha-amylase family glycosyl hydrolase [Hyphomonas sp.]|uniref:alpha-amylase family glycosyl hydrolase n=1 Tax=Hyphomonas sp. TaxID=87 RepID=UPI003528ABB4